MLSYLMLSVQEIGAIIILCIGGNGRPEAKFLAHSHNSHTEQSSVDS